MAGKTSISIVIPAYNEEQIIADSVRSVESALGNIFSSYEIIVVNDCSRDNTGKVADELAKKNPSIKVIHHEKNRGMGQSLLDGFLAAKSEYVGSFPGDNGLDPEPLAEMFRKVGEADVISYYISNPEFRSWQRRFLSWLYIAILNTMFGLKLRYYNGHAIYRTDRVKAVKHTTTGHAFLSETLVRLMKSGASIVEIPALQHERKAGGTKAFSLKNFVEVGRTLIRLAVEVR